MSDIELFGYTANGVKHHGRIDSPGLADSH